MSNHVSNAGPPSVRERAAALALFPFLLPPWRLPSPILVGHFVLQGRAPLSKLPSSSHVTPSRPIRASRLSGPHTRGRRKNSAYAQLSPSSRRLSPRCLEDAPRKAPSSDERVLFEARKPSRSCHRTQQRCNASPNSMTVIDTFVPELARPTSFEGILPIHYRHQDASRLSLHRLSPLPCPGPFAARQQICGIQNKPGSLACERARTCKRVTRPL
ncbi:hypothetical protein DFP72DRAFT_49721 [Ephemerocybe angulata]|uniref:Uncharacterized protein n=1 Tax=Ephemerocybe angulata TaxID=980116 RepID=A0A8H6LXA3_9AGAR|nr:hypothetical protein DFP72DRAFT_49721 [Tulosesus angulatus]